MPDTYADYAALAAVEVEGVDYSRTTTTVTGATWCSIAIHGGGIERGSGEVARAVAGSHMSSYEFAGLKSSGNDVLHITASNFDEPQALALVGASARCLSFHGFTGTTGVEETWIGGLDTELRDRVIDSLDAAGFTVSITSSELAGTDPANICNLTTTSAGVQLEMSRALRDSFFPGGATAAGVAAGRTDAFYRYVRAVQAAYIGYGRISLGSVNVSRWAVLTGTVADGTITASFATDKLAAGGSQYLAVAGRYTDTANAYLARLGLAVGGAITLTIRKRTTAGGEAQLATYATGLTHTAGGRVFCSLDLAGTTLRARAWAAGTSTPGWQATATDSSLAAGQMAIRAILSSANTNVLPVVATVGDVRVEGSYQTALVDSRAVNGVARAWDAGTEVDEWQPAVVAL